MSKERQRPEITEAHKKKIYLIAIIVALVFVGVVGYLVGKPMIEFVREPERFRAWVDSSGLWGRVAFVGMVVFQLIIAIIPGEPLEMGAGYAFGAVEGTLLCILGCVIGSALVFLFVRRFGVKLVEVFFSREKIRSLRFLQDSRRLNLLTFIVFFIPGTPKDLLSYFIGLTDMKLGTWLLITGVARIPSIVTSTVTGDALGLQNYQFALIAFGATLLLSLGGILVYRRLSARRHPNV
ncbi:MAG TPA: TVP38/TMEM64 family protein [Candidatus Pullichristensenella stercorigallinarum]|uniref:TVP38/TMEM64 family membrane protein n=1 Tax=Candidatus Pullichristensenella stercorigallinarum TaxID=2840909 RepID=A0A9D0ZJP9_9FIRM|nr:TVP38/TMEM64 family protein [Candidatus Pullichristensenella stercorigallinarum]